MEMIDKQINRVRIAVVCMVLFLGAVLALALVTPASATPGGVALMQHINTDSAPLRVAQVVYVLDAQGTWYKFPLAQWQSARALWHTGIVL